MSEDKAMGWQVHNHGPEEGRGVSCPERLIGECRARELQSLELETAWLLEKKIEGRHYWIGVINGVLDWTPDANKALRLSRREDGDRLAEICEDTEGVIEHGWM